MLEVILMIIELMFPTSPAKIDETYPVPVFKLMKKAQARTTKYQVLEWRMLRCDSPILTVIWDVRNVLFFKTFSGFYTLGTYFFFQECTIYNNQLEPDSQLGTF